MSLQQFADELAAVLAENAALKEEIRGWREITNYRVGKYMSRWINRVREYRDKVTP